MTLFPYFVNLASLTSLSNANLALCAVESWKLTTKLTRLYVNFFFPSGGLYFRHDAD
jgi:hypothetical protein